MIEQDKEIFKSKKFRWVYSQKDKDKINEIMGFSNLPKPIAEIMLRRGILSKQEFDAYFNMPLNALLNPFEMLDMEKAVLRIIVAIETRQRICIYGDYDVDGITSTSALYLFLRQVGADVTYYIPNRLEEGYGLNCEAMKDIASRNVKLIITVDCGIGAEEEVCVAKAAGMDVIVTDHHQPSDNIPKDAYAVVNPMQSDDSYPFKYLSGVGVAFKVIMALRYTLRKKNFFKNEPPNIKSFLDIITLGTIADVVPITGENRILVNHGLALMSQQNKVRLGIQELKNVTGLNNDNVRSSHVGFLLAPRINAVGRMGSSDKSLRLLITGDQEEAKKLAFELDSENKFRQSIEREMIKESFQMIDSENMAETKRGLVLSAENWHPGVIGIVASRVVDKYFRPTVILTADNGAYKGSARSIPCFHLYNGLETISGLLDSFGGHKYAAGLKVSAHNLDEFKERFNNIVKDTLCDDDFIPEINIDAFLDGQDINNNLITWLLKLEPFGAGNKEPVFAMTNVSKDGLATFVGKDYAHLKCRFKKDGYTFDSIGYNMKGHKDLVSNEKSFDIAFTVTVNTWRGETSIQLHLKDIKKSGE